MQESKRFVALDVFRGMTVFLMIIVNTPGAGATPYSTLMHADWHGCTVADLVFPMFLFAVGNAISFSLKKRPDISVSVRIIKRTLILFLIGFLLTWVASVYITPQWQAHFPSIGEIRVLAVLQRIAIAFGAAALLSMLFNEKQLAITCAILLLAYWFILYQFGDTGLQYTLEGNAVRKLDMLVLGETHMYREKGISFDPEGLLSTIPSIANVLTGVLTGRFLQRRDRNQRTGLILVAIGIMCCLLGLAWSAFFPLNKKLWTSSFVLVTSGISIFAIAILNWYYQFIGGNILKNFFSVLGKNALFVYILATLLGITFMLSFDRKETWYAAINRNIFQKIFPGSFGTLMFAIVFTMCCWMVAWWMDKRKMYVRI